MLFEQIESKGLAHYSYLLGYQGEAAVIDPRRDCNIYLDKTLLQGYRISHILETHRNEDYVTGSLSLAARTGAQVWHADAQWDYSYGKAVEDGQIWKIGRLTLQAIHSPGHTPGSMNYLLNDPTGTPWMLFTGDTLFAGDVGRVDLLGMDRAEEMAGHLHDTLFNRLLPLGDGVIVCPAHGAGSVCGTAIASRNLTTIGIERHTNPKLQYTDRDDFIRNTARELERPPYFSQMEALNLKGAMGALPVPSPIPADRFDEQAVVLDIRSELGFGGAHVPGSLFIWLNGLSSFAGWFLTYDTPILLVNGTEGPMEAARYLFRLGYDELAGYLQDGMHGWHMAGRESNSVRMVTVQALCHILDRHEQTWILDVRSTSELETAGRIPGANHIHLTRLQHRLDQVPRDIPVYIFCGSGLRSTLAASLLMREGWDNLAVVLGGFRSWNSIACPLR